MQRFYEGKIQVHVNKKDRTDAFPRKSPFEKVVSSKPEPSFMFASEGLQELGNE
jgi:hypothetical protein